MRIGINRSKWILSIGLVEPTTLVSGELPARICVSGDQKKSRPPRGGFYWSGFPFVGSHTKGAHVRSFQWGNEAESCSSPHRLVKLRFNLQRFFVLWNLEICRCHVHHGCFSPINQEQNYRIQVEVLSMIVCLGSFIGP